MKNNVYKLFINTSKLPDKKCTVKWLQKITLESFENTKKAVNVAEKIVGQPSPTFDWKWFPSDGFILKKILDTDIYKYPQINNTRELILNQEAPSWGLIILLVSKASAGVGESSSRIKNDINEVVLHKQSILARVTEMLRISRVLHNTISNISKNDGYQEEIKLGNKVFLLMGDYLIGQSIQGLVELQCQEANELMFSTIRDVSEVSFIEPHERPKQPLPVPSSSEKKDILNQNNLANGVLTISEILGNALAEWTLRNLLGNASLLGKGCQAAVILDDDSKYLKEPAYIFGINLALAMQIRKDISCFNMKDLKPFSLLNAPLMLHTQDNNNSLKCSEIRSSILSGNGIEKSLKLKDELVSNGLEALNKFPDNEVTASLCNILKSI